MQGAVPRKQTMTDSYLGDCDGGTLGDNTREQ